MTLDGRNVTFKRPSDAHDQGIYLVPQEPKLFPYLTIKENILLGMNLTVRDPDSDEKLPPYLIGFKALTYNLNNHRGPNGVGY